MRAALHTRQRVSKKNYVLASYLGQVATRSYPANSPSGVDINAMSRTAHVAAVAITSLQVKFPAWYSGGTDTLITGGLTYTASIEYPAGTFTQVTWASSASVATTGGVSVDTGLSDAATVSIPKGSVFWVRNFCKTTGGTTTGIPFSAFVNSPRWVAQGEACNNSGSVLTDQTMSGTVTDTGNGFYIFPLCIVAQTTAATFLVIGDSRSLGTTSATNTGPDANGCQGQITPSIGAANGWINMSVGGSEATQYTTGGTYRTAMQQYCSHVVNGYGINDITTVGAGRPAARVQGDLFIAGKRFPGKTLFLCTISPRTMSTDGWITTTNQTPDANFAVRDTVNAWAKTVPFPYRAAIDINAQTSVLTDLWPAPGATGDGLHGSSQAYTGIVSSGIINPATMGNTAPIPQFSKLSLAVNLPVQWVDTTNIAVSPQTSGTILSAGSPYTFAGGYTFSATTFNGGPCYTFNGTSQSILANDTGFSKPFTNGLAGYTVAMLVQFAAFPASTKDYFVVAVNGSNLERAGLTVSSTGLLGMVFRRLDADAATNAASSSAISLSTPTLVVGVFNPTAGTATLFVNGTQVATGSYLSTGSFSATNANSIIVGGGNGVFCALTLREGPDQFDSALSTANRQKVEGEIAWYHGVNAIVLSPGHPYYNLPPTS